ncbi:MAG: hypothetical protein WAM97_14865 [Acidimicrobiales bacterium]
MAPRPTVDMPATDVDLNSSDPDTVDLDKAVVVDSASVVSEQVAMRSRPQLETLRSPLQIVFTILGLVSIPFIAYVLSSKAGFDLVPVTYSLMAVFTAGGTIAIWLSVRNVRWCRNIAVVLSRNRTAYWIALQVIPITGFELWHDGGRPESLYQLIPLFALAWAFLWMAGTFRVDSDNSGGPGGRGRPAGIEAPPGTEGPAVQGLAVREAFVLRAA